MNLGDPKFFWLDLAFLIFLASLPSLVNGGESRITSLRCGSSLVHIGDSAVAVRKVCGRPDGTRDSNSDNFKSPQLELWTYLRPNKLTAILVLNGAILVDILLISR
jgi:hypothetical protein